jgi:TonB family protein
MESIGLRNLLEYCLQTTLLTAAAMLLLRLLRLRGPSERLLCWQILLAICLLLPAVERWRPAPRNDGRVSVRTVVLEKRAPSAAPRTLPLEECIWITLAAGTLLRFGLLAVGFRRLRRYRLNSTPAANAFTGLCERLGVSADIRISAEIPGPATFGLRRPVILLPEGWMDDEAIACHELLHVRRRDWCFAVAEECVRSVLWFNPAMWWLIAQIQLAREEAVDRCSIAILNSRERYVNALLAMAAARSGLELAPASPFLRKRHLRARVASLFHEVSMSRFRLRSSLTILAAVLALVGWFGARTFSLQAAPQDVVDGPGVSVDTGGAAMLHRQPVMYPHAAMAKGVQGRVTIEATLSDTGVVTDAHVVSGPAELRKAALESVLEWHYAKDAATPSAIAINVDFTLPKGAAPGNVAAVEEAKTGPVEAAPPAAVSTVKRLVVRVPDSLKAKVQNRLTLHEGDQLTQAAVDDLFAGLADIDEHLRASLQPTPDQTGSVVSIFLAQSMPSAPPYAGQRIKVGGNVSAANLITKVTPVYPPTAKQARIQGTVRLQVVISKEGKVQDVQLVSGHPLLVPSAEEAVWNWVYRPTLLNGNPVEVVTLVDINFTLSQ